MISIFKNYLTKRQSRIMSEKEQIAKRDLEIRLLKSSNVIRGQKIANNKFTRI